MEVHAHSHTERKKWTHYFWEFFMLFLAVTLGFFVENQREHFIEHQRERKYIRSMIEDLKEDTSSFRRAIEINGRACSDLDTLIMLLKRNDRNLFVKRIYYLARFTPIADPYLVCQDKTYEQLKNSGSLRLIQKEAVLNEISRYYQINKYIESGPTPMQYQNRRDWILSVDQLFDAGTLQEMMRSFGSEKTDIPEDHFALLKSDEKTINTICTRYHFMYSTKKVISLDAKKFIEQAASLIDFLKKEYHVK
jgi:hypothetical protein